MDLRIPKIRRARRRAAEIIAEIVLGKGSHLKLLPSVSSNSVYLASNGPTKVVIRIGQMGQYEHFRQAAKAMTAARKAGVSVPEVLLTGRQLVPCAYQVVEHLPGIPGDKFNKDSLLVWEKIGESAHKINQVKTLGMEYNLFTCANIISWEKFICQKLDEQSKFLPTFRHWKSRRPEPFFSAHELKVIFKAMEPLKRYKDEGPRLIHIDLAPRNVLVDEDGSVTAVLDWDSAKSFPAPHQVATATFWLKPDEERAFIKGYGVHYDPRLILAFQLYEYLSQIPYKPYKIAKIARDIILWRLSLGGLPAAVTDETGFAPVGLRANA